MNINGKKIKNVVVNVHVDVVVAIVYVLVVVVIVFIFIFTIVVNLAQLLTLGMSYSLFIPLVFIDSFFSVSILLSVRLSVYT